MKVSLQTVFEWDNGKNKNGLPIEYSQSTSSDVWKIEIWRISETILERFEAQNASEMDRNEL